MSGMVSLILLSGGLSTRFGSPKALASWRAVPLIVHLQNTLLSTNLDEIIVVLGAYADQIKPFLLKHNKIKVVYNKDYKLGQTSSFKAGLQNVLPSGQAVGLLPVDFPLIQTQTLNIIVEEFLRTQPLILVPTFEAKKGHPPFFSLALREKILNMPDDLGLNSILYNHPTDVKTVPVDDQGVLLSFNTVQEFETIHKKII